MKIHREIVISSKSLKMDGIIAEIGQFCYASKTWNLMKDRSPCAAADEKFVSIHCEANSAEKESAVVFQVKNDKELCLANIVPMNVGSLSLEQYNSVAELFVGDFRKFAKEKGVDVSVRLGKGDVKLKDIITSDRVRNFFERYLKLSPESWHPTDVKRLDVFICSIAKYHAKVNIYDLKDYLVENCNWKGRDADRLFVRIKTGLEVLNVYRKF